MVARLRSLAVKLRSACNCANEVRRQRSVNRGARGRSDWSGGFEDEHSARRRL